MWRTKSASTVDDPRAFPNSSAAFQKYLQIPVKPGVGDTKILGDSLTKKYRSKALELHDAILNALGSKQVDSRDATVYVGQAGIALLLLKKYRLDKDISDLHAAAGLLEESLQQLKVKVKECTFLCGLCGTLAVYAVICSYLGDEYQARKIKCIESILSIAEKVCSDSSLPNELLFGRAGYLYILLYLQEQLGDSAIPSYIILNVSQSILKIGKDGHSVDAKCPLAFSWLDKHYFGAAHGYAGIIYILIKVAQKYSQLNADEVLKSTIDYLLSLRFTSGNYPSSFERGETDKLVHWCHGAPGFVYMFAAAYQYFGDDKYLKAVQDCADVVWQRGLLKKGYGLCHGVAGNAYAFLLAYKITKDPKYLYYTCQFANWCCQYGEHGCRVADRPFSLYEGMAGTAYFLFDINSPDLSAFPGFELE